MRTFVALSDIHFPYEDPDAMKLVLEFLEDFHPDELYLNGDIWDMPQISKYAMRRGELLKTGNLQAHLDHGIEGVAKLIEAAGARRNYLALGNHEDRWDAYLGSQAKELASLKCLEFDQVFKLQGIAWKKYGDGFWLNNQLFLYHGEAIGASWTDKERAKIGGSSITGHQHKQGVTYHRDRARTYKNIGQGCLCRLDPPYLRTPPNWQQGFVYGYIFDADKFRAIEVEIVQGVDEVWMAPEGKMYRTRRASASRARSKGAPKLTVVKKSTVPAAAEQRTQDEIFLERYRAFLDQADPGSSPSAA